MFIDRSLRIASAVRRGGIKLDWKFVTLVSAPPNRAGRSRAFEAINMAPLRGESPV